MNTERSDRFVSAWLARENPLHRTGATIERVFNTTPELLFPLLCPTTEYDWIPGWSCELLHSRSGYAEYNAIFATSFFGMTEIWVCTRYEPNKAIEYSRTSENACIKVDISITDNYDGTITGRWVITASALNEKGNQLVADMESASQNFKELFDGLAHYVDTGQMVS